MIFCTFCRAEISEEAVACPQCGQPNMAYRQDLVLAGFWIRVAAQIIDGLLLLVPSIIAGYTLPFVGGLAVTFIYDWLMLTYWGGQTIGKRVCGIRIMRPDGSPIDSGVAAARSAMALVSSIAFGLGYIWAAFDAENRTWHDMLADTRAFLVPR